MNWPEGYGAEATGAAYQALWKNVNGIRDSWAAMWADVAQAFLGQVTLMGERRERERERNLSCFCTCAELRVGPGIDQ